MDKVLMEVDAQEKTINRLKQSLVRVLKHNDTSYELAEWFKDIRKQIDKHRDWVRLSSYYSLMLRKYGNKIQSRKIK